MTGVLQPMAMNSLGGTGREGKVRDCPLHKKNQLIAQSCLKNSNAQVENLGVNIRDQANKAILVVYFDYRLPNQGEGVDEVFSFELHGTSSSQALIMLGDLNHPDIC